ncbi:sodium-dependent transporter [Caldisalinibacter kiritimatiensis]|uniref:Transporter n=1 Tax=Caldisalinibacter kiritimatiensis TaxID=1304284 RepID=R1AWK5_9FIRM|nr:sodium-dependent transporter [Caldisalinibacter kiritimatiensis]EOD01558.1 Sodium-dependent transporter [Caldisalinibacter kiritimatiensis]
MVLIERDSFASKLGIIAAAAGSAIGLGNIWKFPYIVGENGGGAFLIVYLFCIAIIGLPVMLSEFLIGRKAQKNAIGAFKSIKPGSPWYLTGIAGVASAFIILSFYSVVAGWVFSYISRSVTGTLIKVAPDQLGGYFDGLISGVVEPIFWQFIVMFLTAFIIVRGIKEGIEKYSKILMPILLGLLVVLMIRSVTLEGASKGLEFLFKPDFSSLKATGVLEALGHAFFSLSLGMGTMITYGSYIKKDENLGTTALQVTIADTAIALMAGIVIFPAVFAYGFPTDSGPSLIFITLPAVFQSMPLGGFFQALFFILVGIASLTSTISILEVVVAFFTEEFNIPRKKATILIAGIIFIIGIPSALSFGALSEFKIFGKTYFDIFDFTASNVLLPLGGLLISLFVGWAWGIKQALKEATNEGTVRLPLSGAYGFITKYLAPVGISIILLYATGILSRIIEL